MWIANSHGDVEILRGGDAGDPALGWVAPAYGRVVRTTTLRIRRQAPAPFAVATVIVEAPSRPALRSLAIRVDGEVEPNAVGVRIGQGDCRDTVVFGKTTHEDGGIAPGRRACVSAGDFETDAALLWCRERRADPARHLVMVDGSLVRLRDGRDLIALDTPVACRETDT